MTSAPRLPAQIPLPLALARLSWPRPTPAWSQAVGDPQIQQLRRLRLDSLAWWQVRDPASPWRACFGQEQQASLKASFVARTAFALRVDQAAQQVCQALEGPTPIRFMFIKGVAASAALYPHPALRPMGDVDVWVDPQGFDQALARLHQRGYAGEPKARSPFVVQLRHPVLPSVDLHRQLRQKHRLTLDFDRVFSRSQGLSVGGMRLPVPGPRELFVIQAYSLASGEFVESFNAWVDLRELLLREPRLLDDDSVLAGIVDAGLAPAIWAVLSQLQRLWPELHDQVRDLVAELRPTVAQRLALQRLAPDLNQILTAQRLPRWRQLAVKTLLLKDPQRAWALAQSYFFAG